MKKQILLCLLVISFYGIGNAQKDSTKPAIDTVLLTKYMGDFSSLHIGYYGTAQNCIPYNVYAFKYRKHWFLYIVENKSVSLMLINPPVANKKIDYPSNFFAIGLAQCFSLKYTILKKKKRSVIDINIYGFYKFNKYGKKVIKGLILLDYPIIDKPGPFAKLFQKTLNKRKETTKKEGQGVLEQVNKKNATSVKTLEEKADKATNMPDVNTIKK